jgi:SpoVK/Ycf46/Vps4 family AAA+-type ATPase
MTADTPYTTSLEHILAELERLDLLLRVQVWRSRQRHGEAEEELAAFYIPEAEADALLDKAIGAAPWATVPLPSELREALQTRLDRLATDVAQRTAESLRRGVSLRLVELARLFDLTAFDVDVVLTCLASELDRGYERLYAYLHDDVTRRQPTVELVLNLLCSDLETKVAARTRFTPVAPLFRHHLVQLGEEPDQRAASLLGRTLRLHPRVARFLLDDDVVDDPLQPYARVVAPAASLDELVLPEAFRRQLSQLVEHAPSAGVDLVLYCQGPYGVGKQAAATACCQALGGAVLVVDGKRLAASNVEEFATLARLIDREARLQGALLYWEDFDALLADEKDAHLATLLPILEAHPGPTFLSGTATWEPVDALRGVTFVRLEFPQPGYQERLRLWRAALAEDAAATLDPALDLAALANKFRLSGGQIRDAAATARNLAYARAPSAPQVTQGDLHAACRLHSNRKLAELAQKITPHYTWDDIVLPADQMAQLREIYHQVQHRALVYDAWGFDRKLAMGKGLGVLFAGPPGTGKTMAADVLAGALGLDLYKIDLSTVVSKYIGETEKNLARIFGEARTSNAILFFDEADALFGKRTQVRDAHDRYANVEISYLLQKMEEYDGVVVLATNLRKNLDEAFVRRLQVTVEFPVPDVADRRRIWAQIWPAATPRDPDLDLEFLAREVEVAGGSIRNIALAGAFLAAADGGVVTMAHLLRATHREYQKMGKVLTARESGEYARGVMRGEPS